MGTSKSGKAIKREKRKSVKGKKSRSKVECKSTNDVSSKKLLSTDPLLKKRKKKKHESFTNVLAATLQEINREDKVMNPFLEPTEETMPSAPSNTDTADPSSWLWTASTELDIGDITDPKSPKLTVPPSTKKRKLEESESSLCSIAPSAKRSKVRIAKRMETVKHILWSQRGNLMGTLFIANIIGVHPKEPYFMVDAISKDVSRIPDGILPFTELCDSATMSQQLSLSISNLIRSGCRCDPFMKYRQIPVMLFDISEDGMPVFTSKTLFVCHGGDSAFPRLNAFQRAVSYRAIERSTPMIGSITSKEGDGWTVTHGLRLHSTVDDEACLRMPFHHKEVARTLQCGQTVIGHIDNGSKLKEGHLKLTLGQLHDTENDEIIASNQSFMMDFANVIRLKSVEINQSETREIDQKHVVHSGLTIGDVVEVTLSAMTPTLIEFYLEGGYHGFITRPQHCGSEREEWRRGMKTRVRIIDFDLTQNKLIGSIRLSPESTLDANVDDVVSHSDVIGVQCSIEWVSDNGYLVLQIISNRQFVVVPFATPYLHLTYIQAHNLFFKIGQQFEVHMIGQIELDLSPKEDDETSSKPRHRKASTVWLGHIPSWIGRRGYFELKMQDIMKNAKSRRKYYTPYDYRFKHPAQIVYHGHGGDGGKSNPIRFLRVKVIKTTKEGNITEIAPDFYPKIVIPVNNGLDLESKMNQMIRVHINEDLSARIYSNYNRQIVIPIHDVVLDFDESNDTVPDVVDDSPSNRSRVGQIVNVKVTAVSAKGISVEILPSTNNAKGCGFILPIHISDVVEEVELALIGQFDTIHTRFGIDSQHTAVVIDVTDRELIQVSVQKSVIQRYSKLQDLLTHQKVLRLDEGEEINGMITKIEPHQGLFLNLGVFGVAQMHITNTVDPLDTPSIIDLQEMFNENAVIRSRVLSVSQKNYVQTIHLSLRHLEHPNVVETPLVHNEVEHGAFVTGVVSRVDERMGIIVWLSRTIKGRVSFRNVKADGSMTYAKAVRRFRIGTVIKNLCVVFVSPSHHNVHRVELKMASKQHMESQRDEFKREHLVTLDSVATGDFMTVKFQKRDPKTGTLMVFVPRSDFKFGYIPQKHIAGKLLKKGNVEQIIKGDRIQCWVLRVVDSKKTNEKKEVQFTMRSDAVKVKSFDVTETVNTEQREETKKYRQQRVGINMMREFKRMQKLKKMQGTVSKASNYKLGGNDVESDSEEEEEDDIKPLVVKKDQDAVPPPAAVPAATLNVDTDTVKEEEVKEESNAISTSKEMEEVFVRGVEHVSTEQLYGPPLPDSQKEDVLGEMKDDVVDLEKGSKSKGRTVKEQDAMTEVEEIAEWSELMTAEGFSAKPKTPRQFEKMLIGSPNSSIIWIQYIAFYLAKKNSVIAREIIRKALKRISVSEDAERINIWIAWMNLEMLYGNEQAVLGVFRKALKSHNAKEVYRQFVGVLQQNKRYEMCNQYLTEMVYKWRSDVDVYILYGQFLYQRFAETMNEGGDGAKDSLFSARDVLKRGIQNTKEKTQHVALIKKFAYFEYKFVRISRRHGRFGDQTLKCKGPEMFEKLMEHPNHSKEPSMWKQFALCELKFAVGHDEDRLNRARIVLERATNAKMKLPERKRMFKIYLAFEKQYGSKSPDHQEQVDHIKELARNFVQLMQKQKIAKRRDKSAMPSVMTKNQWTQQN